jgi:hypothetical protein
VSASPTGEPIRRFAPLLGLAALGLLTTAGGPLSRQQLSFWVGAAVLYGVLAWLLLGRYADEGDVPGPVEPGGRPPRLLALALVIPFAFVAWKHTSGNKFDLPGVIAWWAAVAAWVWAWRRGSGSAVSDPDSRKAIPRSVVAALLLILAVGAVLYFHRLAHTPGEPTSDHAETLLDLTDVLSGKRPIFFIRNTGREPWKFYWLFLIVKVFGLPADFLTTKVGTVTIGLLAIPAMFLLGRELGGNRLGLFAAALVSWSQWPLAISRVGIRVSYAVFPTAMVLWALLRYLRRGDRASSLWTGIWIGIGLYGYVPFRIVPLLVPLAAALALVDPRWRGRRRRLLIDLPVAAVTAGLVFLPLLHFMLQYPQFFWERMAERSSLAGALSPESLGTLLGNIRNMALAFNVRGDGGWVNFVSRAPFLDVATGALFLAGIAVALSRVFRGSARWLLPVAAVFVLTLPSVLILTFAHENPSVNRSAAAIPAVFLLAATPLDRIAGWLQGLRPPARIVGFAAIASLLILSIVSSYRAYFFRYDRQYSHLVEHTLEMAREIRGWERRGVPRSNAYVLNDDYWIDPRIIGFELRDAGWAVSNEVTPGTPPPKLSARPLLFVLRPSDTRRRLALRTLYPEGEERTIVQDFPDRNFNTYLVR